MARANLRGRPVREEEKISEERAKEIMGSTPMPNAKTEHTPELSTEEQQRIFAQYEQDIRYRMGEFGTGRITEPGWARSVYELEVASINGRSELGAEDRAALVRAVGDYMRNRYGLE